MSQHKGMEIKDILSRYYELFYDANTYSDGTSVSSQLFVDNTETEMANMYYWMENFTPDVLPTATDPLSGEATYSVQSSIRKKTAMMDVAAPHSETNQRVKGNNKKHSSSIPRFNVGNYDTAFTLTQAMAMAKRFGNDTKVLEQYKFNIQDGIEAGHYSLNRMAGEAMSEGTTSLWGALSLSVPLTHGMEADQFHTPTENWQDSDTDLLSAIEDFVSALNSTYSTTYNWIMQASDTWVKTIMLNNSQVISEVGSWVARKSNGTTVLLASSGNVNPANITPANITYEDIIEYSKLPTSRIPPIEIQIESQDEETATGRVTGRGWNTDNVAFKPAEMSGVIKWTDIPEIEMSQAFGADNVSTTYAYAIGGIVGIINSVVPVGTLKDFHTDFYMGARPQLTDFQYRHIVYTDKTTTNS